MTKKILFELVKVQTIDDQKAVQVINLINEIVNTDEFKDRVLKHEFLGKPKFADTPFTNEQVYDALCAGNEIYDKEAGNGVIEVHWQTYRTWKWWSKVLGYTLPLSSPWVYTTNGFFSRATLPELCDHVVHESMHLLGFVHPNANRWGNDVPYAVGEIVYEMAKKLSK